MHYKLHHVACPHFNVAFIEVLELIDTWYVKHIVIYIRLYGIYMSPHILFEWVPNKILIREIVCQTSLHEATSMLIGYHPNKIRTLCIDWIYTTITMPWCEITHYYLMENNNLILIVIIHTIILEWIQIATPNYDSECVFGHLWQAFSTIHSATTLFISLHFPHLNPIVF